MVCKEEIRSGLEQVNTWGFRSYTHSEILWTKFVSVTLKAKEATVGRPAVSAGNC